MSGIYIHIPFCKQACHYCNFHFSTSLKYKEDIISAIIKEIELSKEYLPDNRLKSIYFGGGTPSLLDENDLERIIAELAKFYVWEDQAEITLEANPDDLHPEKIKAFTRQGINRWSLGIQSFVSEDLLYMNRAHDRSQAIRALADLQEYGTNNITVDLIYGTPTLEDNLWIQNIENILEVGVPHMSCYALTVEEGTALAHFIKKGKTVPVDPDKARNHFDILMEMADKGGYVHYEISNFALPGFEAVHNSNYWKGVPYLGLGPSAHSFDGISRRWNISNNALYRKAIEQNEIPFDQEILSEDDQYNEYIMTGLRTIWGVDLSKLSMDQRTYFKEQINQFMDNGFVKTIDNVYRLTKEGKHLADYIAMELFID